MNGKQFLYILGMIGMGLSIAGFIYGLHTKQFIYAIPGIILILCLFFLTLGIFIYEGYEDLR